MISLDDELCTDYLAEAREHLATMEANLLAIEKGGAEIDEGLVNGAFRAVHSIKGGAGFFDLAKIRELAHQTEDALALLRSRKMVPTPDRVQVLLRATDRLHQLIQDPGASNQADIAGSLAALAELRTDRQPAGGQAQPQFPLLRCLLVEDDFTSRLVLQTFLSRYGECHIAVNGREAVEAFRSAFEQGQRYDLICMDIMMPEMDGREAVRQMRAFEEAHGVLSTYGAKIIMTTALDNVKEVIRSFQVLCDAYLVKPIDLAQLLALMKTYRLVP
jgi:two-component system, chemotaxis family, chemotaxis protein CheY